MTKAEDVWKSMVDGIYPYRSTELSVLANMFSKGQDAPGFTKVERVAQILSKLVPAVYEGSGDDIYYSWRCPHCGTVGVLFAQLPVDDTCFICNREFTIVSPEDPDQ